MDLSHSSTWLRVLVACALASTLAACHSTPDTSAGGAGGSSSSAAGGGCPSEGTQGCALGDAWSVMPVQPNRGAFGHVVERNGSLFANLQSENAMKSFTANVWRLKQGASKWEQVDTAVGPTDHDVYSGSDLAVDADGRLYTVGSFCTTCNGNACCAITDVIRTSDDGGDSWSTAFTRVALKRAVGAKAVAVGGCSVYASIADGVVRSTDHGATWSTVLDNTTVLDLTVTDDGTGFAATGEDGAAVGSFMRGTDNGSWKVVDTFAQDPDLPPAVAARVSTDGATLYTVAARAAGWKVRKSSDGGSSWSDIEDYPGPGSDPDCSPPITPALEHLTLAATRAHEVAVAAELQPQSDGCDGAGVYLVVRRSSDAGAHWSAMFPDFSAGYIESALSPRSDGSLVLGGGAQLLAAALSPPRLFALTCR